MKLFHDNSLFQNLAFSQHSFRGANLFWSTPEEKVYCELLKTATSWRYWSVNKTRIKMEKRCRLGRMNDVIWKSITVMHFNTGSQHPGLKTATIVGTFPKWAKKCQKRNLNKNAYQYCVAIYYLILRYRCLDG